MEGIARAVAVGEGQSVKKSDPTQKVESGTDGDRWTSPRRLRSICVPDNGGLREQYLVAHSSAFSDCAQFRQSDEGQNFFAFFAVLRTLHGGAAGRANLGPI